MSCGRSLVVSGLTSCPGANTVPGRIRTSISADAVTGALPAGTVAVEVAMLEFDSGLVRALGQRALPTSLRPGRRVPPEDDCGLIDSVIEEVEAIQGLQNRLADLFYENSTAREELIEEIGTLIHMRASGPE